MRLLSEDRSCFVYTGFLAMLPYTENSDWVLFESPKSILEEQLDTYINKCPDSCHLIQNSKNHHFVFKEKT